MEPTLPGINGLVGSMGFLKEALLCCVKCMYVRDSLKPRMTPLSFRVSGCHRDPDMRSPI